MYWTVPAQRTVGARRAHSMPGASLTADGLSGIPALQPLAEPKVGDEHLADPFAHQNVLDLHVTVHNPLGVDVVQRLRSGDRRPKAQLWRRTTHLSQLVRVPRGEVSFDLLVLPDVVKKIPAVNKLQQQEEVLLGFPKGEELHHVWVVPHHRLARHPLRRVAQPRRRGRRPTWAACSACT